MVAKRIFDIVLGVVALVVAAPVMMVAAVAIVIANGGPVVFSQERIGRNSVPFRILKFRTMATPARKNSFDAGDARRVTALGQWLRRTKLDELPQLWNVAKGDMSFVGPRPEVRRWVEEEPERFRVVLTVRPGITDPASIRFRHEEQLLAASSDPEITYRQEVLPEKLAINEHYVATRSFMGDLVILARTVPAILSRQEVADAGSVLQNR